MSQYQVGDEAELGPALMNRFISAVVAQGGTVSLKGNKAVITSMPGGAPAPEPEAAAVSAPGPEPVIETEEAPKKAPTPRKRTPKVTSED